MAQDAINANTVRVGELVSSLTQQLRQVETRLQESARERLRSDAEQGREADANTAQAVWMRMRPIFSRSALYRCKSMSCEANPFELCKHILWLLINRNRPYYPENVLSKDFGIEKMKLTLEKACMHHRQSLAIVCNC